MKVDLLLIIFIICQVYANVELKADPKTTFYATRQNVLGLGVPETDLRLRQNLGLMFTQDNRLLANKLSFLAHFNLEFPIKEYRHWLGKMNTSLYALCSSKQSVYNESEICKYHKETLESLEMMQQTKVQKVLGNLDFIDNIGHNTVVKNPRIKRGIFSFGLAKFLFSDLIHKKDFGQALDHISRLEEVSRNTSGTFEFFKKDLTSIFNVYNQRLDNLREGFSKHNEAIRLLTDKQNSLRSDLFKFKTTYLKDHHKILTMSSLSEMGNLRIFLLNDLDQHVHSWLLGLMSLSGHKISHDIISHPVLRHMLHSIKAELRISHPFLKLAIDKVEDYYSLNNAYAYITKHEGTEFLKVVLDIPLIAKDQDILLYQVKPLSLPIKSHQGSKNSSIRYAEETTSVTNVPDYLGVANNYQGLRTFIELNASDLGNCQELTPSTISCNKLWVPKTFVD